MQNLEIYRNHFEEVYKEYSDSEYSKIIQMINSFPPVDDAENLLNSSSGKQIFSLIIPLIEIKNYKSQIPFPVEPYETIVEIIKLKNTTEKPVFSEIHESIFNRLLEIKGFQLPTISAIFHFCHPDSYPIVDKNIKNSCKLLAKEFSKELEYLSAPILPGPTTSPRNKLNKYKEFVHFLTCIKELHNTQYATEYDYRDLDKALMVYGVEKLKYKAESNA